MLSKQEPVTIFISYARNDSKWLELLSKHLKPYLRNSEIDIWDDRRIHAGEEWRSKIQEALERAAIAVLLVTPDFLASDFIASRELPQILERARDRGLILLWLAVKASAVMETPIMHYQALNDPKTPLVGRHYAHRDQELSQICLSIRNEWLRRQSGKVDINKEPLPITAPMLDGSATLSGQKVLSQALGGRVSSDTSNTPCFTSQPITHMQNISGLERSQLTRHYIEQAEAASSVDIITLTMQAILENYGNERLIRWISQGKRLRILMLSPFSMAAKLRSKEESGNEFFLSEKVINQVQILGRVFDLAKQRINGEKGFLGSLEVKFYDGIPYYAYFRTEHSVTIGLYYSHINGLQSEVICLNKDSTIYSSMMAHFSSLWERTSEQGNEIVCVISQKYQFLIDPTELRGRFLRMRDG